MHFPHSLPTSTNRLARPARAVLLVALAGLVAACASAPPQRSAPINTTTTVKPVEPADDLLLKLLSAQFALQDNNLALAAKGYAEAAELSPDPALAEEATRLALSVKDWPLATRSLARWQVLAPGASGVLQARAWIALGENRNDAAYADLLALSKSSDKQAWRLVAQALVNAPDKAAAAHVLDRLATPEQLGSDSAIWVAMSQLAFKLDDKALSRRLSVAAVARFHSADAYVWSARLALDQGDKALARTRYADAVKLDPKNLRLRIGYAALLADSGDNAAAARELAVGPQDDASYAARAAYWARADDKKALASLYREVQADTSAGSGDRSYLLGQIAEMLDQPEDALKWYRSVDADEEHGFDARMREAVVLADLKRIKDALAVLHRLAEQAAGDSDELRTTYLLEAELLLRSQRAHEALAVYARGLVSLPDDPQLLYARALLAVDQGDVASGERDLRRVIELKPGNAEAMNALGYTLADNGHQGDPQLTEALDLIQRALLLKPEEPAIIDSMGWVRYRMGDQDGALKALRRAYAKQPDADVAAHLGEVLWVNGEHDEARKVWNEGHKKDPDNKTLGETIKRLGA